ncbi:hypothetical protein AVEN_30687-1 [Araneus ventricosus]|uniref:Uncharacterized protein n=1 Tax=Araneus ventricosus TaxID=182803 RepID=A0A4Y2MH18_ARAVE|nr:hypothetical protein AVEN_40032-1 [Araneus ventricosus]GBN25764.1 hypothetical protein AVEN_30687-1 [Araneus ventricosus]
MINVQFTRDLVKSLIKFIQREPVNILKSRIHIRKRTLVPQRSGRHNEIYSAQYISTIDRTIYYLVEEKNTRNISSGTQTRYYFTYRPRGQPRHLNRAQNYEIRPKIVLVLVNLTTPNRIDFSNETVRSYEMSSL